jgi:hypothetical protein
LGSLTGLWIVGGVGGRDPDLDTERLPEPASSW